MSVWLCGEGTNVKFEDSIVDTDEGDDLNEFKRTCPLEVGGDGLGRGDGLGSGDGEGEPKWSQLYGSTF